MNDIMDQLYIEIEICPRKNADTEIYTTVQSFVVLYIYRFMGEPANVKLNFVRTTFAKECGKIKLRSESLRELTEERIIAKDGTRKQVIRDLCLPVYEKDSNTYIAGMCAVCRELVVRQPRLEYRKLLGFKESCLLAPSEASIWTRFCEVNVVEALSRTLHMLTAEMSLEEVPEEAVRFERHMKEPVRMHNIYKLAREQARKLQTDNEKEYEVNVETNKKQRNKVIINCTTPKEDLAIKHRFAEGVTFTIADLILYPCMRLIFECCVGMLQYFPLISNWMNEIKAFDINCEKVLKGLCVTPSPAKCDEIEVLRTPTCEAGSLYKSDPKRYKPRNRIYTVQSEVDVILTKLKELQIDFDSSSIRTYGDSLIDWHSIEPSHAVNSALPEQRLERKRQQLENLANAVASLAVPGDRIVDFCSGTGHLGILLALKLPDCAVILIENKPISLQRAKQRAAELGLSNCCFYQCNIDYFEGEFDVGASLHACGTATDIVLQQCKRARAKFVCCPCCYGSLQPVPHISYPLSGRFRKVISERDYMYIAHTADQAHALGTLNCKPETTRQGQLCMDIVDTDRKLQAEEAGYEVILTRLKPEECTPKNRLLIGQLISGS